MLGIGLLFVGLSAVNNGEPIGVLAGLGGFYLLARQFEESRHSREEERRADQQFAAWQRAHRRADYDFGSVRDDIDRKPTTNADRVYSHALQAVQSAGLDASNTPVLPVDIGVFTHKEGEKPQLYRTRGIPKDVDYIQPFVQLRLPQRAKGHITFELLDDFGETVFLRTEEHDLKRGRNLVVPSRRLPVHDALDMGDWTLKVSADDTLLAVHPFDWHEPTDNVVSEYIRNDGEISNELRAAMAESHLEDMSLDELLSYQDDTPPQQSAQQKSS